jgi:hypothetical protein
MDKCEQTINTQLRIAVTADYSVKLLRLLYKPLLLLADQIVELANSWNSSNIYVVNLPITIGRTAKCSPR